MNIPFETSTHSGMKSQTSPFQNQDRAFECLSEANSLPDDITKKKWDRMHARKKEQEIAHEQHIIAIVDCCLPDEVTRRSPFYDPDKPIKKPDFLKRMPRGGPTTSAVRSNAAAARRRRSREE